jgi:hypothetical protein
VFVATEVSTDGVTVTVTVMGGGQPVVVEPPPPAPVVNDGSRQLQALLTCAIKLSGPQFVRYVGIPAVDAAGTDVDKYDEQ